MSLSKDLRTLAAAKTCLNHIDNELRTLRETDLIDDRFRLKEFIDRLEDDIRMRFLMSKYWISLSTGKFEVLENERLCRKELDEKPFVMSYDMRNQFKIRPWHWMAWRSLRMAQIESMEAGE